MTRDEILMGRDAKYPLSLQLERNLQALLNAIAVIEEGLGRELVVTSGYRPGPFNAKANGATHSAHKTCEAVDVADPSGLIARFCLENIELLERAGLYMEAPSKTPGWLHLQTRPTKRRVFLP